MRRKADRIFLCLFGLGGLVLILFFLPPVSGKLLSVMGSFSPDGEFNVTHWSNFLTLLTLKFLFLDIILFLFFIVKTKSGSGFKNAFEASTDFINRMSRPVQMLLAFALILIFHSFINLDTYDDAWFKLQIQDEPILSFVSARYFTWTSRFLIEFLMTSVFAVSDGLWRVLDSIAFVVIAESFVRLAVPEEKKRYSYIGYILLLFLPVYTLSSCGWGAVTCNYIWPVAEAMPVFVTMKKLLNGKKIPAWQFAVSILLAVMACCQEQMAALVFGITLVLFAYTLLTGKRRIKDNWYFIAVLLVSAASIVFALTCPGNSVRYETEMNLNFPEYDSISAFKKFLMSIPTFFSFFFGMTVPNIVILPLLATVTVIIFCKNYGRLKLPVILLDLFVLVFGYLGFVLSRFSAFFIFQNKFLYPYGTGSALSSIIECSVFVIMAAILTLAVFRCSGGGVHGLLNVMLLAASYCCGAIQAFSPTVYEVSGGRMLLLSMIVILYVAFDLAVLNMNAKTESV